MARTKGTGTNSSASETQNKAKVAKVSKEIGQPNQDVAAIRERYKLEEKRQKSNFAKASEDKVLKTIRDLTKNSSTPTLRSTDKDTIRSWLTGNIYSNSANLIRASRYLYYRSSIYAKMIALYTDMYCLDCRIITPDYSFTKEIAQDKIMKQYENTINFIDSLSLQGNMNGPLTNMFIEDICYFWRIDNYIIFIYNIIFFNIN